MVEKSKLNDGIHTLLHTLTKKLRNINFYDILKGGVSKRKRKTYSTKESKKEEKGVGIMI